MNSSNTFLGLSQTHWLAIVALLLGFALFLMLILVFRSGGNRNKASIRIDGPNQGDILIDQRDQSVKQTQIHNRVNVNVRTTAQDIATPTKNSANRPDDDGGLFAVVAAVMLIGIPLYVRYFDSVVVITRAMYFFVIGSSLMLTVATMTGLLNFAWTVLARFVLIAAISLVGGVLLWDSQSFIPLELVVYANKLPLNFAGAIQFIQAIWKTPWLWLAIASGLLAALALILGTALLVVLWRIFRLVMIDTRYNEGTVDLLQYLPSWGKLLAEVFLLVCMLAVRFIWLPHALSLPR